MMARLVALDTETTGLDPRTEQVFEIAVVDIATNDEQVWRIQPAPKTVERMHPKAAEVNLYHERTASRNWKWDSTLTTADDLRGWLDGSHVVGAVPDFDTRHLTSLYRDELNQEPPRWHYHLIDVEAMAVGWLHAGTPFELTGDREDEIGDLLASLPWRSDDLSRACGVEPPSEDERHTALGDARWVARWYRALTGGVA